MLSAVPISDPPELSPVGWTHNCSPPPSLSLTTKSAGFAALTWRSVSFASDMYPSPQLLDVAPATIGDTNNLSNSRVRYAWTTVDRNTQKTPAIQPLTGDLMDRAGQQFRGVLVPGAGIEPATPAPESAALPTQLPGRTTTRKAGAESPRFIGALICTAQALNRRRRMSRAGDRGCHWWGRHRRPRASG